MVQNRWQRPHGGGMVVETNRSLVLSGTGMASQWSWSMTPTSHSSGCAPRRFHARGGQISRGLKCLVRTGCAGTTRNTRERRHGVGRLRGHGPVIPNEAARLFSSICTEIVGPSKADRLKAQLGVDLKRPRIPGDLHQIAGVITARLELLSNPRGSRRLSFR
jgi:hypothetical protein